VLEAWVDFPEEGLEFLSHEEMVASLESVMQRLEALISSFHQGKMVQTGVTLCLIGPPNAGKSSLMNALLGAERAIVTPIAGTTRDVIEENMRLGDIHYRLIDTAGIRKTDEVIEQEGIRRSKKSLESADVVLCVLDATAPVTEEVEEILSIVPKDNTIVLWNKVDAEEALLPPPHLAHALPVSVLRRTHFDKLYEAIASYTQSDTSEIVITSERHYKALVGAQEALQRLLAGLKSGVSAEFVAADMREARLYLGSIVGEDITEEMLSAICSTFCVGK